MSPERFTSSQYDPKSAHQYSAGCRCLACFEERTDRLAHPARPVTKLPLRTYWLIVFMAVAVLLAGILTAKAIAREGGRPPQPHACMTVKECRQAVKWQRKARRDDALRNRTYGVDHAIKLASALYGVPLSEMRGVALCETGGSLNPSSQNRASTAAGLFQFLDSTWARAGVAGFSVYDPYANAIAAARLVTIDHGWHEWSCGWAAR